MKKETNNNKNREKLAKEIIERDYSGVRWVGGVNE